MARTKGTFGTVRKLPSGKYQASFAHKGKRHNGPHTFDTEPQAREWLTDVRYTIRKTGKPPVDTADPLNVRTVTAPTFAEYAERWIAGRESGAIGNRPLAETSAHQYRKHIAAAHAIGRMPIDTITPEDIAAWHYSMIKRKTPNQTRRAYTLVKTIMAHAERNGLVEKNPCRVEGATAATRSKHVPVIVTRAQIDSLAAELGEHGATVQLAAWCSLRLGEVLALRRRDIDLTEQTVTVSHAAKVITGKGSVIGDTKTDAANRIVSIPDVAMPAVREVCQGKNPDSLLFPAARDATRPVDRSGLSRRFREARVAVGVPTLRFHDLRHTGLTRAGQAGASLAELMARAGHTSPQMVLHYQSATRDRDRELARKMSQLA